MTMTSRRTFTFASLAVAAGASTARAGQLQAGPDLGARWSIERTKRELVVTLAVANRGKDPIDLLVKRGSSPGPYVTAALEVEEGPIALSEIHSGDRRELMSRMGPIPQYQTLASGADLVLGPWRFTLPEGADREAVSLVAQVTSLQGNVEMRSGVVASDTRTVSV